MPRYACFTGSPLHGINAPRNHGFAVRCRAHAINLRRSFCYRRVALSSLQQPPEHPPSNEQAPATPAPGALTSEAKADHEVLESLAKSGTSSLQEIGASVKNDLESVSASTQAMADEMIAEETEALLSKYDEKQEQLLATVKAERRVIEREAKRIEDLAGKLRHAKAGGKPGSPREKILAAVAGLASVAALVYAWTGFVSGDTGSLQNAGLDAVVAAVAVYLLQRAEGTRSS